MEEDMIPDLIKSFDGYGDITILDKTTRSDGEGGMITVWTEGATVKAAVMLDNSIQMRTAQAQGVKGNYTVTTEKPVKLPWRTVFRRESDGMIFRVTSHDEQAAPTVSTIQTRIVTAEEWELPTDE